MRQWLARPVDAPVDLVVLGAPISKASITLSQAWSTPPAFRAALDRFPTWDAALETDVSELAGHDLGDVIGDRDDLDASAAHQRIQVGVTRAARIASVVMVVGGDNSLTRPAVLGVHAARPELAWGLLTLDAHHDCRPAVAGSRNGTPVRELIEAGLPGARVAQVGIHPQGNAREHSMWVAEHGVHVHPIDEVASLGVDIVLSAALEELTACGAEAVYVDIDMDVVDRAFAPACPASLPGGMSAGDVVAAARILGRDARVMAADLCEIDANADVAGVSVRLMAATFTAFAAGLTARLVSRPRA